MTWILKERGDTTGTVRLEYLCPVHGRFELDVPRGESPDEAPCPRRLTFDRPVTRSVDFSALSLPETRSLPCAETSPWSPTIGLARVKVGEVVRGKIDEYPGEKHVMNTQALADGMPLAEFKARRAAVHRDISLERVRKLRSR